MNIKSTLWLILFILICFCVPIFSIESIFPWIIFLFCSSRCIKAFKNENLMLSTKLLRCFAYCLIAISFGFGFNWFVNKGTYFIIHNLI